MNTFKQSTIEILKKANTSNDQIKNEYIHLLNAIIKNSGYIISASQSLLTESLKKKNQEEKYTFVALALNYLFAAIDELGKFYLVKKFFAKKIIHLELKSIGFYTHDKKLLALIKVIRERQMAGGGSPRVTVKQTISFLRIFKDTTLYIDYKNKKIIKPSETIILRRVDVFNSFIQIATELVNMAKLDLEIFKKS